MIEAGLRLSLKDNMSATMLKAIKTQKQMSDQMQQTKANLIGLGNTKANPTIIANDKASKNEAELQLLREYAEHTKASCLITEGADNTELKRRYEALEAEEIQKAENREKTRQEAEKKRKEDHEFYSLLRMSDTVYR